MDNAPSPESANNPHLSNPNSIDAAVARLSERRREAAENPRPVEPRSEPTREESPRARNARAYEGSAEDGIRQASAERSARNIGTGNPDLDVVLDPGFQDPGPNLDDPRALKLWGVESVESDNRNTPGWDAKKVAEARTAYNRFKQAAIVAAVEGPEAGRARLTPDEVARFDEAAGAPPQREQPSIADHNLASQPQSAPAQQQPQPSEPPPHVQRGVAAYNEMAGAFLREYPDIRQPGDLDALERHDPQRAHQARAAVETLNHANVALHAAAEGRDPETAILRAAAASDLRAAKIAKLQQSQVMSDWLGSARAAMEREFPELRTRQQLERMRISNPARAQAFEAQEGQFEQVRQNLMAVEKNFDQLEAAQRSYQQTAERTDFAKYARIQDAHLAQNLVPELADPKTAKPLHDGSVNALRAAGFSDKELVDAWNSNRLLRDARTQAFVVQAVRDRQELAELKARFARGEEAIRRPHRNIPSVQMPGIARPAGAADAERVGTLSKQLESAKGPGAIRIAAQLLAARRSNRG